MLGTAGLEDGVVTAQWVNLALRQLGTCTVGLHECGTTHPLTNLNTYIS